jgi:hypothetical protein
VKDLGVWQWKRWLPALPATMVPSSWSVMGVPLARLTLGFEGSLIMAGAGAIMGIRAGASLLLAAVIGYGVLAPIYIHKGDIVHDPPAVTAASGFVEKPRVESGADLALPAAVEAGRSLVFVVREAGQAPAILGFTWKSAASYETAKDLLSAMNAPSLLGEPNPFAGSVVFGFDEGRNRIYAEAAKKPAGEASLEVDASGGPPALGFAEGAMGRALRFPVSPPEGTTLTFVAAQGTGPGTDLVEERITLPFPAGASYTDEAALLTALNSETLADGTPNPAFGKLTFAVQNGRLTATAVRLRQWDARLTVEDSPGVALLGFAAGQSRSVSYGGFRNIVRWLMWPGVAMMVTAGLLSFFMQWRTVIRAFAGLGAMFRREKPGAGDPLAAVEVPASWFAIGVLVSGLAAIVLQTAFFGISWWMGVIAVVMSFFLAIVACRATGETDITPVGAMGKITQLLYGGLAPGNMVANLMTANVTAGAATSSADLLQALRTGFMVGASPRKQFVGMLIGVVVGSLVSAPVYNILIPSADVIGTDKLPAPAAQTWAGVALLLSTGLKALPESARWGLLWGGLFGIVMTLLERAFPKARKYMPSPTAMGIAFVIPAFNSVSMFLGAFVAWILEKRSPALADRYTMSAASGLIAGESLMGIAVAILIAFQFM